MIEDFHIEPILQSVITIILETQPILTAHGLYFRWAREKTNSLQINHLQEQGLQLWQHTEWSVS